VTHLQLLDVDAPLEAELTIELPTAREGSRRVSRRFFAAALGATLGGQRRPADYLVLDRRVTPMVVRAADERLRLRVSVPAGWQIDAAWDSVNLVGPAGRVTQQVDATPRSLTVERMTRLDITRVGPNDYPDFVRWARSAAEAVDRDLVLRALGGD